jgi:hypothetical protein
VLPVPNVKVSPSLSMISSSFRRRLPWVPCTLLTNVPYFERSTILTQEGLAGAPECGSQATTFSTTISACTRDIDVSVCVISQPIAGMPTLIYDLAHQYSLYKPLNHMLLYWQSIVSRACTKEIQKPSLDCISDKWIDRTQIQNRRN